jgi:STE24 endopeptidase
MRAEIIFYIIFAIFIVEFIFTKIIDYLNTLNWSNELPKELENIYDKEKYKKSMKYEKTKYYFYLFS